MHGIALANKLFARIETSVWSVPLLFSVVGDRQNHKRCELRWKLTSNVQENLEPITSAPALELGRVIHLALGRWSQSTLEPDSEFDPVQDYVNEAKKSLKAAQEQFKASLGFNASEDNLTKFYEQMGLGVHMVENYVKHYKTPLPSGFVLIQSEQRIVVEVPGTEHWECNNCHYIYDWAFPEVEIPRPSFRCRHCGGEVEWQRHKLRGTLDELVQSTKTGKLYVRERKTYAIRPTPQKLRVDDQMLAYYWLVRKAFGEYSIDGILYDGLWKRDLSKRHPKLEELFYRQIFKRNEAELERFEKLLVRECNMMAATAMLPLEEATFNRRWEGCYDCSVAKICEAMLMGDMYDHIIADEYRQRASEDDPDDDRGVEDS